MQYLNIILFWIFFGFLCSYIAKKKARNPNLWFWLGILLGVLGVLLVTFLPKQGTKRKKRVSKPKVVEEPKQLEWEERWFYLDKSRASKGPLTLQELQKIWKEEECTESTYVWKDGMEGWKHLKDLPDLQKTLKQ
jgi:hypothetical protein